MRLTWRPQATQERTDVIDYIAEDNPSAALGQLDRIEKQTDMLLQQPKLGRVGRVKGTRELVISRTSFIVIYRLRARSTSRYCASCMARSSGRRPPRQPRKASGNERRGHGPPAGGFGTRVLAQRKAARPFGLKGELSARKRLSREQLTIERGAATRERGHDIAGHDEVRSPARCEVKTSMAVCPSARLRWHRCGH